MVRDKQVIGIETVQVKSNHDTEATDNPIVVRIKEGHLLGVVMLGLLPLTFSLFLFMIEK